METLINKIKNKFNKLLKNSKTSNKNNPTILDYNNNNPNNSWIIQEYLRNNAQLVTISTAHPSATYRMIGEEKAKKYTKQKLEVKLGKLLLDSDLVKFTEEQRFDGTKITRIELLILKPK